MNDLSRPDGWDLSPPPSDLGPADFIADVPRHLDVLSESGREVLVIGDVERCKDFNHKQGANLYGFEGTCGLVSVEDVLNQFGKDVSENDVVRHAIEKGLCFLGETPADGGGTTLTDQARLLSDAGVPAHPEQGAGFGDLARWVGEGRGVILEVNAGVLWNDANAYDSGQANHAVVLTGAAVSPDTGELLGFYVNDSGRALPGDSGHFVSLDRMRDMWQAPGGLAVVTDTVKTFPN
jgi:hypothetical protein